MGVDVNVTFEEWKRAICSEDDAVRSIAADEVPYEGHDEEITQILIAVLHGDRDALARTGAADSLGHFPNDAARNALRKAIETETDSLALCYIFTSLGMIGELQDLSILTAKIEVFKADKRPKFSIFEAILCLTTNLFPREMFEVANNTDDDDPYNGPAANGLIRVVERWIEETGNFHDYAGGVKIKNLGLQKILDVKIFGPLGEVPKSEQQSE